MSVVRVKVTGDHIAKGKPCSARYCPLALAIGDAIPPMYVSVGTWDASVGDEVVTLPAEAVVFRRRFDGGLKTSPFEFDLDVLL